METKICQSCGMSMTETNLFGTNHDNSLNQEYCIYCFKEGNFTSDSSMEEMIEHNLMFLDEFNKDANTNFDEATARKEMFKFFPTLKRWNK